MKYVASALLALLLAGCSSIGQEVASGINNSQLSNTIGKPYSKVIHEVGSSRVDLQACKLEYSIVSPK